MLDSLHSNQHEVVLTKSNRVRGKLWLEVLARHYLCPLDKSPHLSWLKFFTPKMRVMDWVAFQVLQLYNPFIIFKLNTFL